MKFIYKELNQAEFDRLSTRLRGLRVAIQGTYVVDEKTGICLVDLGETTISRDDEVAEYYNLLLESHTVAFKARSRLKTQNGITTAMLDIISIQVPKDFNHDIDALRKIIEGAFTAYKSGLFRAEIAAKVTMPTIIDWV